MKDIPIIFWKEWSKLSEIEQFEKIKVIVQNAINQCDCLKDKKELREEAMAHLLNSYFDDLYWALK